jgi:peptidyl-prolyl cis-trans isomerase B (cyclophilin B)
MTRTVRSLALLAVVATLAVACNVNGTPAPASNAPSTATSAGSSAATGNCPTKQPPPLAAGEKRLVTISTAKGEIAITIEADLSPIAAGNFVALAECGYYDGVGFHRIATLEDGTPFVIQGGDPTGDGTGGPGYTIKDEAVTALYSRGTVAMARTGAPDSVGSQFFIVLDDKDRPILADANTYQIIGTVTAGMETVDAIYTAGAAEVNPASPVVMDKVTVSTP